MNETTNNHVLIKNDGTQSGAIKSKTAHGDKIRLRKCRKEIVFGCRVSLPLPAKPVVGKAISPISV